MALNSLHQPSGASKFDPIRDASVKRDVKRLAELAIAPKGLVDDESRRKAWPVLLGCSRESREYKSLWQTLPIHPDEDQVKLDVDRSFVNYPPKQSDDQLIGPRIELQELITATIRHHPSLHYFQGYHDIVQVFLLVLGFQQAHEPVQRLSLLRIRDFMLPTLGGDGGEMSHLRLLPRIIHAKDPELARHLSHLQPFFALAAILTLYAHDIEEYGGIARLFDFLLASGAVAPLYLFAVIVSGRKSELLEIDSEDTDMLHFVLSKLPKPLDLEAHIADTVELMTNFPPKNLPNKCWKSISPYSVLKTASDAETVARQFTETGKQWFALQVTQVRRAQAISKARRKFWKHRRPIAVAALTLLVGLSSYWMRHTGSTPTVSIFP